MRAAWPCHLTAFVVGTLCATAAPMAGADPVRTTVVAGDRVRYRTSDRGAWTKVEVLDVRRDSWLVRPETGDPAWVSTSAFRRAEVFREEGPLVMEGFLFGLVPGALLGAHYVALAAWTTKGRGLGASVSVRF